MPARKPSDAAGKAKPHYHGHRERLRKRFQEAGPQALADYELLELVLFRAIPLRDVKPLAKDLIEEFGSFAEVISAPIERLKKVKGLGDAAATELKIMQAVAEPHDAGRGEETRHAVVMADGAGLLPDQAGLRPTRKVSASCFSTSAIT